ncbi:MAG: phosphate acyltransferase PlsX [Clostridiaceae bacterium]|nr:phosphate acyltransferase PlsX [Clostridiaceae bacterium]
MRIIVDAMGGDNAPQMTVRGCMLAVEKYNLEITLVGNSEQIKQHLTNERNIKIVHSTQVVSYDDEPTKVMRTKPKSSMLVGLSMLAAGEGDAFVSAGNTGALVTGTTLIVKRIKGIRRIAIAPIIPVKGGAAILVDGGANVDCTAQMLCQFAMMGSIYAEAVLNVNNPTVGLLNNGTEAHKGNKAAVEAYEMLRELLPVNFMGNIEARDIFSGKANVLVADGFTGNILLKAIEGTALYFSKNLKDMLTKSFLTKISALILKNGISDFKKKFDYNEHGGAPLLGANGAVIKAHGSSGEVAFCNAIRQAKSFFETDAVNIITDAVNKEGDV